MFHKIDLTFKVSTFVEELSGTIILEMQSSKQRGVGGFERYVARRHPPIFGLKISKSHLKLHHLEDEQRSEKKPYDIPL